LITRDEAERIREELLRVLAEDAHNTQRLLERLDSITRESGVGAYSALLLILTHLAFDETDARRHWEAVLANRQKLSAALGRDSGIRVALLDYFMNINRRLVQPTLIDLEMLDSGERDELVDPLTGLAGDRAFRSAVQTELRRAKRYDQRVALVLFDLDDFARVNETFGELVGDRVLREAAILLSNNSRDIDLAARPGEDELAVLLPETGRNGALLVAERFRGELEAFFATRESNGRSIDLTISGGVACYPDDATSPERLLERGAQALYMAKASGKNAIQLHQAERRRYLRFDLEPGRFEVEVLAPRERGGGKPRNLSRNGILFVSPEPIEVGDEIEIRLVETDSTDDRELRVRGWVVRLEELPEPEPVQDAEESFGEALEDRYEIGVAFDLDRVPGSNALLDFLEKIQGRSVES